MNNTLKAKEPKVSIIIPVYNGHDFLANAIECALMQSYSNIEIIVVNDGSNDNGKTEKIAKSYGKRIRYFYKDNGGVSSALNYGIQKMEGEYFSWLSHDDGYAADKIKDSVELLINNNQIGGNTIAFTSGIYIDSKGKELYAFKKYFEDFKLYSGVQVIDILTQKGTINGCCMLIPKKAFIDVGGFDESLRYSQDSLMWYRIFLKGYSLISDNKANVMYRLHENQTSKLRRDLLLHDSYEMSKIIIPTFVEKSTRTNNLLYKYAKRYAVHECRDALNECIKSGQKTKLFTNVDILRLNMWLLYGKIRNLLKNLYLVVRLK